jgi:hypothetical protein
MPAVVAVVTILAPAVRTPASSLHPADRTYLQ